MIALPTALRPLTEQPRWVGWRWIVRNGKQDKPLFRAYSPTQHASTQDPTSWAPFRSALEALQAQRVDGIGYVVRDDAVHIFIDLDDCRNPQTGELEPWAQQMVEEADSYTEITPSGCGIRIIGHAGCIAAPIHTAYRLPAGGHGEVFYRAVRYVTVTGNRLPGTPDAMRDISDVTLDLLASAGRAKVTGEAHSSNAEPSALPEDIAAALTEIPNADVHWDDWVRVGLATWRASGGSEAGREAWRDWSAKSAKHDDAELDAKWAYFRRSPPTKIGFGTLFYMAKQANADFVPPTWDVGPQGDGINIGKGERPAGPQSPLPLIYFSEAQANLDCADFVEGVLTERAMSVVYGESNAGKTFFVTDLAIHVAIGRAWRDREIEQGGVIYCALEGRDGIMNRIAAFKEEYGADGADVPFAVIPVPINLLDPNADRERLRDAVRVATDTMGCPVKLVVIDTLSRALAGGNENAPDDMGALVASADYIRQEVQAHILFIHHSGKDAAKGARGHSLLRAATDTEIEVTRPEGEEIGSAKVTKQRDLPKGDEFLFKLKVVTLGKNRRGKAVTSCVVEDATGAPPPRRVNKSRALSDGVQVVLTALENCLAAGGQARVLPDTPRGVPTVTEREWRENYYGALPTMNPRSRETAFKRGTDALAARRVAILRNGYAWLVKDEPKPSEGAT